MGNTPKALPATYNRAHHAFAVFTACAAFVVITAGALVTSNDAGLSVPDWPTSFGYLVKVPHFVGGVRYEWSHRMVAGTLVTLTLASPYGRGWWSGGAGCAGLLWRLLHRHCASDSRRPYGFVVPASSGFHGTCDRGANFFLYCGGHSSVHRTQMGGRSAAAWSLIRGAQAC